MIPFKLGALAFCISACSSCPHSIQAPDVDLVSVGMYVAPVRANDGKVSLAIRILNHAASKRSIWINSSIGRSGSAYGSVTPVLYDDQGKEVPMFCTDDSSRPPVPAYKVLRPGESIEGVVRPWCVELDPERTYLVQVQWDDSYPQMPPAPSGAQPYRGPLIAQVLRIAVAKTPSTPDWSAVIGN